MELAELQDSEVGDGTTSVVIVAAELLKRGTELVKSGIHPTTIMTGFRLALKDAVRFVKSSLMVPVCQLGDDAVVSAAKTSMASKLLNADELFWSRLAVDAVRSVKTLTAAPKFKKKKKSDTHILHNRLAANGKARYPVSAIHILKAHGKSSRESELVNGFAINLLLFMEIQ